MSEEHLILCGGIPAEKSSSAKIHKLQLGKGEGKISLDVASITEKMVQKIPAHLYDLLKIATYVYVGDQVISRGGLRRFDYGQKWNRCINFRIPIKRHDIWNAGNLKGLLEETLSFASGDTYTFDFVPQPIDRFPEFLNFKTEKEPRHEYTEVVLFSGGLDSFTGVVEEVVANKSNPILVSHRSNNKMVSLQRKLYEYIAGLRNIGPKPLNVAVMINKDRRLTRDTSQRTRSFLYASLGAIVAQVFDLNRVKVYENGVVSCNLSWDGQTLQARSTRSTHPKLLYLFSELVSELTDSDFYFENPYFTKTKTGVCLRLRDLHHEPYISETRSCAQSTYINPHNHCGTCSQCIDRRFATLASECGKHDPEWLYALNIFTENLDNIHDRAMAAGFAGFASVVGGMNADGFVRKFSSEVHEIARYLTTDSSEDALNNLFLLHHRHAKSVNTVMDNQLKENASSIRKGILPETCLLSIVARGEHLRVDELLKIDKSKKKHKKTKKRKRRISSELTKRQQEAFQLVHIQGLSLQQAAIEMRCSAQNVSKLLQKAEEKIKARQSRSVSLKKTQRLPEDRRSQVNISEEDI